MSRNAAQCSTLSRQLIVLHITAITLQHKHISLSCVFSDVPYVITAFKSQGCDSTDKENMLHAGILITEQCVVH